MLKAKIFNSLVKSENVTASEKVLGYFLGPIGVAVMNCILMNYLNVYYTDVIGIAGIMGGAFLSLFPVICKIIDAGTFVFMGRIVDGTRSPQGKARPWILLSAPVLLISMIILFAVPTGNEWLTAGWIFISYNLFYSVGYTAYSTSHTLLLPLATKKESQRNSLSVISNAMNMLSGTFLTILFPCLLVPYMGVNRERWLKVIALITAVCCPLLLLEYYFTKERVTDSCQYPKEKILSLKEQFIYSKKSRQWLLVMLYFLALQLVNAISSASIFYYCNWVLGNYNDGFTQALYYGIGNAPLGLGIFLCRPICKKLGRYQAMGGGFLLAALGCGICLLNPSSLPLVLAGQAIKSVGLMPSAFMGTTLLGDALDDVEKCSHVRCDGFTSSIVNIVTTISGGVALFLFNFCLNRFGYCSPAVYGITAQNTAVKGFFSFCALGVPAVGYLLLFFLLQKMKKKI